MTKLPCSFCLLSGRLEDSPQPVKLGYAASFSVPVREGVVQVVAHRTGFEPRCSFQGKSIVICLPPVPECHCP